MPRPRSRRTPRLAGACVLACLAVLLAPGAVRASAPGFVEAPGSPFPTGSLGGQVNVAVTDVTGDGQPDALVGDTQAATPIPVATGIRVLRGGGAGRLGASFVVPVVAAPFAIWGPIRVADVNGDGSPDLLVAAASGLGLTDPGLYVVPGLGSGAFGPAVRIVDLVETQAWNVGDVGGPTGAGDTALPDIASITPDDRSVRVWVNAGTPGDGRLGFAHPPNDFAVSFPDGCPVTLGGGGHGFALFDSIADVTGDAEPDIVVSAIDNHDTSGCTVAQSVQVFAGNGSGASFSPTVYRPVRDAFDTVVGDFTGDGRLDVATGAGLTNAEVLAGLPGGGLDLPDPPPFTGATTTVPMSLVDLDGSGSTDVVGVDDRLGEHPHLSYELGSTAGLAPTSLISIPSTPSALVGSVAASDLNGDGQPDLVAELTDGRIAVLLNTTPTPPSITAEVATAVGATTATVGASVDPHGSPTHYHVEWGSDGISYGSRGPDLPATGELDGTAPVPVTAQMTGLSLLTLYHWRIVATSAVGTTLGADQTLFTTAFPHLVITPPGPTSDGRHGVWGVRATGLGSPIVAYGWDWNGDGRVDTRCAAGSPMALHTFAAAGTHPVGLTVTTADGGSLTGSAQTVVAPGNAIQGAPPNPNGGGCASVVGDTFCTTHVEWELVTADIVGPGCFQEVRPVIGSERCVILDCGVSTSSSLAGQFNMPVPPTLWERYRHANAKILVAVPAFGATTVAVKLDGTIITAKNVLVDELYDSIYAPDANVDLAPSADGSVPATPLARGATVSAPLPTGFGFPDLSSARGPLHGRPFADPIASNPCDGSSIQGAPLLGSFADPKTAGLGSQLGGLRLGGGPVTVHLVDGHVVVCVDIDLPTPPCFATTSTAGISATLVAEQSGLVLQDLHAHLGCALIAGVVFTNVSFAYDGDGRRWAAAGTVEAIPGLPLTGSVAFAHGDFESATVGAQPTFLLLGPLQLKDVHIGVFPDHTTGDVRFGSIPNIPGIDAAPLTITGGYDLFWGSNPAYFRAHGEARLVGVPIANGQLLYYQDGRFHADGHVDAEVAGILHARADLDADFWQAAPLRFNAEASATISVFDLVDFDGQLLVSDRGAGGCVGIEEGPFHLHVGSTVHWDPFGVHPMFHSCDVGGERDSPPQLAQTTRFGRSISTFAVPVAAGTRYAIVGVSGSSGPPAVELDGPNGEHVVAPTGGPTLTDDLLVLHDAARSTTYAVLRAPSAGSWTVSPLAGSTPITSVRSARELPPVAVRAKVVRTGPAYRLQYDVARIPGQTVRFVERGPRDLSPLGVVTAGGSGSIGFTPPAGLAGQREILAIVEQDGSVRTQLVVTHYAAPAPRRPARPTNLHGQRRGTQLVVTWDAVAGATAYLAELDTSDGRRSVVFTSHPSATLAHVHGSSVRRSGSGRSPGASPDLWRERPWPARA